LFGDLLRTPLQLEFASTCAQLLIDQETAASRPSGPFATSGVRQVARVTAVVAAVLRRNLRLTVEGGRPNCSAICRTLEPSRRSVAIRRRSEDRGVNRL
jgi:hypothetical protein